MASREEESSSSDSSEESSSEEENQQQEGGQDQSSSSDSGEQSGSAASGNESEGEGGVSAGQTTPTEAPSQSSFPNTQDLFGGDSSSESSSGSESDVESKKNRGGESPAGSGTPEPPQASPLGGSPVEGGEEEKGQSQTVEGIFGDAADLSSSDEDMPTATARGGRRAEFGDMDDELPLGDLGEEGEGEGEVEEEEAPRINVDIPRCVAQLGTELYFVKLPNFLSVETRPFDPELYEDEGEDDDVLDEEGRARLKLKVENTIRWRYAQDEDGNEIRESNARVVRWTDGSMSLYLGSEIFDISRQPLQGEYSHLFVRQGTGLQGQAVFRNKLTFRPHSTDSQTHRKMTLSIADRFSKAQKIRVLPVAGMDPESQRSERIKKEEENLRAAIRQEHQQRRMRESHVQKRGLTANYLEPDRTLDLDEDISAIKSSVRSRVGGASGRRGRGYESVESSEGEEEEAHERLLKAKGGRAGGGGRRESPERTTGGKRQTRASSAAKGGGGRKGVKSRKLIISSDEESD